MNIFDILMPILAVISGLYLLEYMPWAQQDQLLTFNQKTAPILEQLVQTKYFRIIRLNINENCEFGLMKRVCKSQSCTVCRCDDKEIPDLWTSTEKVKSHTHHQDLWANERSSQMKGWVWHVEDEANDRGEYFDIHTNI